MMVSWGPSHPLMDPYTSCANQKQCVVVRKVIIVLSKIVDLSLFKDGLFPDYGTLKEWRYRVSPTSCLWGLEVQYSDINKICTIQFFLFTCLFFETLFCVCLCRSPKVKDLDKRLILRLKGKEKNYQISNNKKDIWKIKVWQNLNVF